MSSTKPLKVTNELVALPLARIDTQDDAYVFYIREFLETNGCEVTVNKPQRHYARYHIICGDSEFVEPFADERSRDADKHLFIVWNEEAGRVLPGGDGETKYVFVDPRPLTPEDLKRVFVFFFTSRSRVLDIRKEHTSPIVIPTAREQVRREETLEARERAEKRFPTGTGHASVLEDMDKRRIAKTLAEVFSKPETYPPPRPRIFSWQWGKKKIFRTLAFVVVLIPLWYILATLIAGASLAGAAGFVASTKSDQAVFLSGVSSAWTRQGQGTFRLLASPLRVVGAEAIIHSQEEALSLLADGARAIRESAGLLVIGRALAKEFFVSGEPSQRASTISLVGQLRSQVVVVQDYLALSEAHLRNLLASETPPFSWKTGKRMLEKGLGELTKARSAVTYVNNFLTIFPRIGGFTQKQTYLVLLQNSMELRPTGGFIGSVGILTVQEGKMTDLTVHDVYALDGQLKGHVDPPAPIRDIMGQEHWYLRDSNWDPDFRVSAAAAAWFYEKETGEQVDGVIGVSVPLLMKLLEATGPITLPDYNDRVSADNFFGKSLLYTQVDFFPGSTQKKDFLGSLVSALLSKITGDTSILPAKILQAVTESVAARDILFYFPDPDLEALILRYGWGGEMGAAARLCVTASPVSPCLSDSIGVVGANVGVNKLNYFIKYAALGEITLTEDGGVGESLTFTITNTATAENDMRAREESTGSVVAALVRGTYRTYLQFVLPGDIALEQVLLDGVSVAFRPNKGRVSLPYLETRSDAQRTIVGVALDVPASSARQLHLSYKRATRFAFGKQGAAYELLLLKQPGVPTVDWQIVVRYPLFWTPLPDARGGLVPGKQTSLANEATLEYNTTLTRDATIRVPLVKP